MLFKEITGLEKTKKQLRKSRLKNRVAHSQLFTGPKGNGICILDVDRNLAAHKKKWSSSLDGAPCITSTKCNAAKFVFKVPEELWGSVKGRFLSQETSTCYEILWNRQGLIFGAYPGSKTSEEGV